GPEVLHGLLSERIRGAGCNLPLLRLHADLDERVDLRPGLRRGTRRDGLGGDALVEGGCLRLAAVGDRVLHGLRLDLGRDRRWVRLWVVDDAATGRRVRLAEIDGGRCRVDL